MKILFVTPYMPSPPRYGAQRRLDGLMRGLAKRHEVSLLAYRSDVGDPELAERTTRSYCKDVVTLDNDIVYQDVRAKRLLQLRSLASRRSFEYFQLQHPALQPSFDRLFLRERYDVVQVEFSQLGFLRFPRRSARRTRFVLDEHNIEYEAIRRMGETANTALRKLYATVDWRKLRREELLAWKRFDGVSLVSARDEELLLRDEPQAKTVVVPNAVDLDSFRPSDAPTDPSSLLFFGAMNYHPNVDGVLYFLDEIFPKIQALVPSAKLTVMGPTPAPSVLDRKSTVVDVTGFVEDPRTRIERAAVLVVPLRIGGGTRFKIVEGMAQGKAIVSTRIGAEGLDVVHGDHLLLADEPAEFAKQVERVVRDPALAARLGRAARKLAEEKYGWDAAVKTLETFYERLGT
jgi:glycosyltransferase involved in cell wall biosynthesis